tara:strand:+ start:13 stop:186 length:174 start_codon:yes stop_codon:yes gene_type:complete
VVLVLVVLYMPQLMKYHQEHIPYQLVLEELHLLGVDLTQTVVDNLVMIHILDQLQKD